MPFVQRVVQPTYLSRLQPVQKNGAASVSGGSKFQCIPGKCSNNNCITKQQQQQQQPSPAAEAKEFNGVATCANNNNNISNSKKQLATTQTTTTAVVHQPTEAASQDETDFIAERQEQLSLSHSHTNGFASSFSYATDHDEEQQLQEKQEEQALRLSPQHVAKLCVGGDASAMLPMKKLKQHVEFLSTSPSPARSGYAAGDATGTVARSSQRQQQQQQQQQQQSPTSARIVSGYEFESICNITLSNALRQLASLVLLASDIFDELQQELQNVGARARVVQRKIDVVEKKICAYDPKMVTVPESDLLTFAQRKIHYESDKSAHKELFSAATRPRSVKVLYEDAGRVSPSHSASATPRSTSFASDGSALDGDHSCTGASQAAGSDELDCCTSIFGKTNRKMRTRIDAEIEIRLPAAIEDLRKWTSSEALGDVTVTPDCMHHVDTSICTSVVIGDNGILTPALSPSVLSADAVDALYSINVSNTQDNTQIPNDINKDVPLNHRLPSPEEQCKIIALRYPAELISVDTSGKRFERMCLARKSTTGCVLNIAGATDSNNLNDDVQTVSRRSRSRKVRGKRRNTIAGIDQKEIQDAANGDSTATSGELKNTLDAANVEAQSSSGGGGTALRRSDKSKKFGRSKSSDILKKESVALPYDKGKSTLTRLNSLKQWGRNRFRFMQQRTESSGGGALTLYGDGGQPEATNFASQSSASDKGVTPTAMASVTKSGSGTKTKSGVASISGDIDDACVVHQLIGPKSEGRFSHERKPSYSSSEKSMSVSSSGHLKGKLQLANIGAVGVGGIAGVNVKLRDTSSLNRQRRNVIAAHSGLAGKDDQPHSSSGNWSASSESGRASIGSEITLQPKSSASNTSLNVSSFHAGSGPPSSMLSRRRFLNTSASSSVTSEGTATPDLPGPDAGAYNNQLDDETSSAYSCDTEGYYTSFHMDSGLRTLKEEELPMTPLQSANQHMMPGGSYSFGSQSSNQTVHQLTAENEYELYGRGSTSTTTSSAGTVCTTLLVNEHQSLNSMVLGPEVPERISSLAAGKLSRSSIHSNSASTSTLERSYSSSTMGSTLERTGTIKRNVNASLQLAANAADEANEHSVTNTASTPESQEEEFSFEQRLRKRSAQPLPSVAKSAAVVAELECSESSDLEGVERIERIKQKTALNAKRIPSMCIITPSTSDDENQSRVYGEDNDEEAFDGNKTLTQASLETSPCTKAAAKAVAKAAGSLQLRLNEATGYCTIDVSDSIAEAPLSPIAKAPLKALTDTAPHKDHNLNLLKRSSQYGFNNMLEKLKVVLPSIKRSPSKSSDAQRTSVVDDVLYDTAGEYVTIADISNNNNRHSRLPQSGLGVYYSNDIVRRGGPTAAKSDSREANEPGASRTMSNSEYISLNELPQHLRKIATTTKADTALNPPSTPERQAAYCADSEQRQSAHVPMYAEITELRERPLISPVSQQQGARVKLNAEGRIVYDSDSLRRRRGSHTTFAPGPYVKETESAQAAISATAGGNSNSSSSKNTSESASHGNGNENYGSQKIAHSATTKQLFLNGAVTAAATRRQVANVQPLVAKPLNNNNTANTMAAPASHYYDQQGLGVYTGVSGAVAYTDSKQLLNPFLHGSNAAMLSSPSARSTSSSTGSTISSSVSTSSSAASASASASAASQDEGYQRLYRPADQHQQQLIQKQAAYQQQMAAPTTTGATPFQRNAPVYWTLQNRKQPRSNVVPPATCRDDLYATPIRRSERVARAAAVANAANAASLSPIVPRSRSSSVGFLTSTPTKYDSQLPAENIPAKQPTARNANWDDNSPERLNTCADRIGQSKTSLMDFKKLLLAKSVKNSPVQKKMSAVELLKKNSAAAAAAASEAASANATSGNSSPTPQTPSAVAALNASMKLLDLSGSPKTFANRRMLRHGQFGSPSKSFAPKLKGSPGGGWRAVQRTDIMSTTIPEAHSEEDQSSGANSSGGSKTCSEAGDLEERLSSSNNASMAAAAAAAAAEKFNLKRNFFLQTEENNFMRGELKKPFAKTSLVGATAVAVGANSNQYVAGPQVTGAVVPTNRSAPASNYGQFTATSKSTAAPTAATHLMPALETAL